MKKLRLFGFSILMAASMQANAQWVTDLTVNTPICSASKIQSEPSIIPDGVGGAYMVWKDYRNLNTPDAFLQRVNKDGIQVWIVDGLNLVTNPQDQSTPRIVSDGNYGVIAVWSDFRNGTDRDIFAQRVDSSGIIQWTYNGTLVVGKTTREYNERIISDGQGGAIIAWEQGNTGSIDVWAQRIDANGVPMWDTNGIALTTAFANKTLPRMVLSPDSMIYFVWQDNRNGQSDIYAQKMDLAGNRMWGNAAKPVINATDQQTEPRLVLTENGYGIYVAWVDRRLGFGNQDIFAQKLDSAGTRKWVPSGVPLVMAANNQNAVDITTTNKYKNGFVATWRDYRVNAGTSDVYAQKIDSLGVVKYATDGIVIANASGDQLNAQIAQDTNGGVIIAWQDKNGGNSNLRAQKLDTAGVAQWGNYADISTAVGEQQNPQIIADGEDGLICVFEDIKDTANQNIFAQRLRKGGRFIPTSVTNFQDMQVAVYPNPFTSFVTVTTNTTANIDCKVLDMMGREVASNITKTSNALQVEVKATAGIYFLQLKAEGRVHVVKVVKE